MSFDRAILLFEQRRYELAEEVLRQELLANPEEAQTHALLALTLAEQEKKQEAFRTAQHAIHLAPDQAYMYYTLARVLERQDKYKEAKPVIEQSLQLAPQDSHAWALLASLHFQARNWEETLKSAEQGLIFDPEHDLCTNLRAQALIKLGRRNESGQTVGAALARDPQSAITHANQGWILLESGDHVQAMDHFREALRLDPTLGWARAGIVEALKARNIIYRLMLQYFFWMNRLSGQTQWLIVIGGYFGYQFVRNMARTSPSLAPIAYPLMVVYVIFVYLTWTSETLFNLLLRLDNFGRLALDEDEIMASNIAGTSLFIGLAGLAVWGLSGSGVAFLLGLWGVAMVIPIGGTFRHKGKSRKILMALMVILGLIGLIAFVLPGLFRFFWFGILGFTILANVLASRE